MLAIRQRYRRTDGRTDGRTTYDSNTALALRASRGKNEQWENTRYIDNVTVEKLRAATKGLNFEDHTQIASKHLGNRGSTHHNSGSGQLLFQFTRNRYGRQRTWHKVDSGRLGR